MTWRYYHNRSHPNMQIYLDMGLRAYDAGEFNLSFQWSSLKSRCRTGIESIQFLQFLHAHGDAIWARLCNSEISPSVPFPWDPHLGADY